MLFTDAMIRTSNGIFYIANDSVEPHKGSVANLTRPLAALPAFAMIFSFPWR
jgi:hypothetical protein